jgi:hypothetical protein
VQTGHIEGGGHGGTGRRNNGLGRQRARQRHHQQQKQRNRISHKLRGQEAATAATSCPEATNNLIFDQKSRLA